MKMIKFKSIGHDPRAYFKDLVERFASDEGIVAVYLFGSYARGEVGPLSDVDIGVLLRDQVHFEHYFDKQLDLMEKAAQVLRTDEVDLVILNQAPAPLAYRVIRERNVLFCRDERERILFETKAIDRYLDEKPMRALIYQALIKRIEEGRFAS